MRVHRILLPLACVLPVLTGCGAGSGPPAEATPSRDSPAPARTELAARAAAAQDLVGVSSYTLATPGGEERSVVVVLADDGGWRVDIEGGALGGAADVGIAKTGDGLFHCALPAVDLAEAACVRVDGLAPEYDPRVHHVFTDWLDVLTDRTAPLAVSTAAPLSESVTGACFAVQPSTASLLAPLDPGVYCYEPDGTLTGARLDLGTLALANTSDVAPPAVDLPGPVVDGDPLPTAPPPSPSTSP